MIMKTMIAVTMVVLAITATYADEPTNAILPLEVEKAVLVGNWGEVAELIGEIDTNTPSLVLRLLKAHASLVANRNNESVGLFSVVTFGDLEEWEKWCKNIANTTNNQALINYFLGDIYARLLNYEKAIEYLSLAINQNKNSYLALNARGTVYIIQEEYGKALSDLIGVKAIKTDFADVYNNLAMINIRQKKGLIDNSKNSFLAVLKVNPDFALAYHGIGCIELLESKDIAIPKENKNIQNALKLLPKTVDLLIGNETKYTSAAITKQANIMYADVGSAGTSVKRAYQLTQAVQKVDAAEADLNSSSFWGRGAAKERVLQAKLNVTGVVHRMDVKDIQKTDQYTINRTLNITANNHKYTQGLKNKAVRGSEYMRNQGNASTAAGLVTTAMGGSIVAKVAFGSIIAFPV